MEQQINKQGYNFNKYCTMDRWCSYWHQIDEILMCAPRRVLEVGVGDKVVCDYFKNNTQVEYATADIASDLNPDVVCDIEKMPFVDNEFDMVCAFEVLEHLPFEKFDGVLRELLRVAKNNVIISLPHWGRHFSVDIRLPFFKRFSWFKKLAVLPIKHIFRGQHYWEIGKRDFPLALVREKIVSAGFKIEKDYIVFESPYHHFFILSK